VLKSLKIIDKVILIEFTLQNLIVPIVGKFNKSSRDSALVSYVLEKIRVPIVTHWNLLKKKLRYLDPMGTSRIEKVKLLNMNLPEKLQWKTGTSSFYFFI